MMCHVCKIVPNMSDGVLLAQTTFHTLLCGAAGCIGIFFTRIREGLENVVMLLADDDLLLQYIYIYICRSFILRGEEVLLRS